LLVSGTNDSSSTSSAMSVSISSAPSSGFVTTYQTNHGKGWGKGAVETGQYVAACIVCVVLLIIAIVLISVSFSKLDANEVGLDYSANSLTIDTTQLYQPGVQFLGVGHSFIKFPTNIQSLDLIGADNVVARTKDGLQITLEAKLLFELIKDVNSMATLYLMFPAGYLPAYLEIARSVIRDVASAFTASEIYTYRDNVTNAMQDQLAVYFNDVFATLNNFLLTDFELPTVFQTALTATETALQEQARVQFEISTTITDTETLVLSSVKTAQIIALSANATATALLLDYSAQIVQVAANVGASVTSYAGLQEALGLSDDELIAYVWLNTQEGLSETPRLISLPSIKSMRI